MQRFYRRRDVKFFASLNILFVLILGLLAASIFVANIQAVHSTTIQVVYVRQDRPLQSPGSVVKAFDEALNGLQVPPEMGKIKVLEPDVSSALDLFSDNSVVVDSSYISCPTAQYSAGSQILYGICPGSGGPSQRSTTSFTGLSEIRSWLQRLAYNSIQVKELGSYQVTGSNVTWALAVSVDEYRSLDTAPLVANAKAVVQDGKIRFLALELNSESVNRLQAAEGAISRKLTMFLESYGIQIGVAIVAVAVISLFILRRRTAKSVTAK